MGKGGTLQPVLAAWGVHAGFGLLGCWLISRAA